MDFVIDLDKLISGEVNDNAIRGIMRYGLKLQLKKYEEDTPTNRLSNKIDFIKSLQESPIAVETDAANKQHYEVPSEFFRRTLDKRLKYSCCYWPDGCKDLDTSAELALEQIVERAELKDGQDILELGCGWGSLSLFMAEKMPNSKIVSISNSSTQKQFIEEQIKLKGLSNLTILTKDINEFNIDAQFDRVVSIEMFEHMRNFSILFEKISNWLKKEGLLFVHIFTHKEFAYAYEKNDNWVSDFFFSGGLMPSDDLLLYFQDHLSIQNHWILDGTHYQKTAEAWLKKTDECKDEILQLFMESLDKKEAQKQFVMWRLFYLIVAESWGYNNGNEWIISHYLFKKK